MQRRIMSYWREASTLIVAARSRPADHNVAADQSEDYRVLMLMRNASSSFLPSMLVFPGGQLHAADHSAQWSSLFQSVAGRTVDGLRQEFRVDGPRSPMLSKARDWTVPPDIAFRICAIRETFEESGLLLVVNRQQLSGRNNANHAVNAAFVPTELIPAPPEPTTTSTQTWRQRVVADPGEFVRLCAQLDVVPDIWALHEWNNWLTPVMSREPLTRPPEKPRRFDTLFYLCCVDCDQLPHTAADNEETVHHEWLRPSEFVSLDKKAAASSRTFAGPQVFELGRLCRMGNLDQLRSFAEGRGRLGLHRYMNVAVACNDAFIVLLPGDYLYPVYPDFEGTKPPLPAYECSVTQITDPSKPLHRIIYFNDSTRGYNRVVVCNTDPPCGQLTPIFALKTLEIAPSKM